MNDLEDYELRTLYNEALAEVVYTSEEINRLRAEQDAWDEMQLKDVPEYPDE